MFCCFIQSPNSFNNLSTPADEVQVPPRLRTQSIQSRVVAAAARRLDGVGAGFPSVVRVRGLVVEEAAARLGRRRAVAVVVRDEQIT